MTTTMEYVLGSAFRVGRDARHCRVVVPTNELTRHVSMLHVRIFYRKSQWRVQDLNSESGTALNGEALQPSRSAVLQDNDQIALAPATSSKVAMIIKLLRPHPGVVTIKVVLRNPGALTPPVSSRQRAVQVEQVEALAPVPPAPPVVPPPAINPFAEWLQDEQNQYYVGCPACMNFLFDSVTLPCGHTLCGQCMRRWLLLSSQCPTCRAKILSSPVQNRCLDDLIHRLFGEHPEYQARIVQRDRTTEGMMRQWQQISHRSIFVEWSPMERQTFVAMLHHLAGQHRLTVCQDVQLTDEAIRVRSYTDLYTAAANVGWRRLDFFVSLYEFRQSLTNLLHLG
ncbi:hypothetical protein Poli38472_008529 [Pythium oligandrum]|uniref:E3 ubiquitin-protein ligase CHFR n=1 Tax=Pythium oligandrum TaxID=41045 RepID=A0A8K1C3K9_PYTOL|nr:hypothetical protein Poli38472_008529 [Pythium oligandrum]|eukprot:TMW55881.1 hypothetical protein Poli38472_008529 [Pythium oligandrum]